MKEMLRFAAALFLLLSPANSRAIDAHDKPPTVRIGAILHLTGEFAMQGAAFREGVELAIDSLNRTIEDVIFTAVYEDSQYQPLAAVSAAKRIAQEEDVVGTVVSTVLEAKAAGKVFEQNKLPAVVLWDSSPELDDIGDYVFGIGPWAPDSGRKAAEFACQNLKAKKAVIINTNTEWSVYVSDWFGREFQRICGEKPAQFSLDPSETDFRTVLLRAKQLAPGALYVPVDSNILPFFKQARQLAVKAPLITSDIVDAELFGEAGNMLEGVYQTMSGDPDFPATRQMVSEYREKFGHAPEYTMLTAWAYDAVKLIGTIASQKGVARESVKAGLYETKNFDGASGALAFTDKGSAPRAVKVFVVKDRKLVPAAG